MTNSFITIIQFFVAPSTQKVKYLKEIYKYECIFMSKMALKLWNFYKAILGECPQYNDEF